ncbi:MAG: hypothetical protein M3P11_02905 [Actinomycetota bacterium]|nr:hypothetical protein [Actinomycetota bacterium]
MAIKGKGKTKTKPVARAPRREPVAVKAPFFMRRSVQLVGAAVAGAAVVLVATWVMHGLNKDHAANRASDQAKTKLAAGQTWKSTVEGALTSIGPASQNGAPPPVFSELDTTLTALGKGDVPKDADKSLKTAVSNATTAASTIDGFDLAGTITGKGFVVVEATAFTDSKSSLVDALNLYEKAAEVARSAVTASGSLRKTLAKTASGIRDEASTMFQSGWSDYELALGAAGIRTAVPSGLPPGVGG